MSPVARGTVAIPAVARPRGRSAPAAIRRIVVIAPGGVKPGGQAVQARALATCLSREGIRVTFVATQRRFPKGLRWVAGWKYLRTLVNEALYLPALLAIRGADAAVVFSASYFSFLLAPLPALLAARWLRAKAILAYHSGEAGDHLDRWGALVHPWLRRADAIVVPSSFVEGVFTRHGYRPFRIHNVVDARRFRFRERRPLAPRLLSTRNLEPHYRVEDSLRAFARIRERHPSATLTIAGIGTEEARLRRLAELIGMRGIEFVGAVSPEAMPRLYDSADLFVNSSTVDNQPVSVLEAFASGLPVVSTTPGGLVDLVRDQVTGLVVPQADPDAIARAVETLLDDPDRARDLARRAWGEVQAYSWPSVRESWMEVLCRNDG